MPRTGTARRYHLAVKISSTNLRQFANTPGELAVLSFLRLCEIEGRGGLTQEEIAELGTLSPRTVGSAVKRLREAGTIQ